MIRDYLGSDYTLYIAMGLLIAWLFLGIRLKFQRKKILYWGVTVLLILHLVFIYYISPAWFGFGTPDSVSKMVIVGDKIILFDNETTKYEDGYEDIQTSNHLRIHIVDRDKQQKIHSELIGTNFTTYFCSGQLYLLKFNDSFGHGSLLSVEAYDIESYEQKTIIKRDGKFKVKGELHDVHYLYFEGAVFIESTKGDRFIMNPETSQFEWYDNNFYTDIVLNSSNHFGLWESANSSSKSDLKINGAETNIELLEAKEIVEYENNDTAYCLIKSLADLTTDIPTWSMIRDDGNVLWQRDLNYFSKLTDDSTISEMQQILFEGNKMYVTFDEYLLEMDLVKGKCNWLVKL